MDVNGIKNQGIIIYKMKSKRRTNSVGNPMLVNLPKGEKWKNTEEGGMAFFLLIRQADDYNDRRNISAEGVLTWYRPDVLVYDKDPYYDADRRLDGGLLIGSTGLSLNDKKTGKYFMATYENLTQQGRSLYNLLKKIYGDVEIITLLDT